MKFKLKIFIIYLIFFISCSSTIPPGESFRPIYTMRMAYRTLKNAYVFSNHCGDASPLTDEAVALYIILHSEDKDKMDRDHGY